MKSEKFDYKKENPEFYGPSKEPNIVSKPKMNFFRMKDVIIPQTLEFQYGYLYREIINTLNGASFYLKLNVVKPELNKDYVVPPIEGIWELKDPKSNRWHFNLQVRIPDFVDSNLINKGLEILREKRNPENLNKLKIESINEGLVVQCLYVGLYKNEKPTTKNLIKYSHENGYSTGNQIHKIYLSYACSNEKRKTIIRLPLIK